MDKEDENIHETELLLRPPMVNVLLSSTNTDWQKSRAFSLLYISPDFDYLKEKIVLVLHIKIGIMNNIVAALEMVVAELEKKYL